MSATIRCLLRLLVLAVCSSACSKDAPQATAELASALSRPGWMSTPAPGLTFEREGDLLQLRGMSGPDAFTIGLDARSAVVSLEAASGGRVTVTPRTLPFEWREAAVQEGRVVFESKDGASALVFTPGKDRIKEDILLTRASTDTLVLEWTVQLDGLQAALSSAGELRLSTTAGVEVFRVPAPVIVDGAGTTLSDLASFDWDGSVLRMKVRGLSHLQYPVSIDPSFVVVTTTADFWRGQDEGGVVVDADAVTRVPPDLGLATWGNAGSLATGRSAHAVVITSGYVYALGGWDGTNLHNDVDSAPIATSLNFTTAAPMPGRRHHAAAVWNERVYVVGGYDVSGAARASVLVAPVLPNGGIGTFTETVPLPSDRVLHSVVAHAGYLYVVGGKCGAATCPTSSVDVQVAPIRPDGSLGAWAAASSSVSPRTAPAAAVLNDHLYITGGMVGTTPLTDVQVAPILEDGTLGPFRQTTALPAGLHRHALVAARGALYAVGGSSTAGVTLNVVVAPVLASGEVGRWRHATPMASEREEAGAVAHNGRLYVVGGRNSGTSGAYNVVAATFSGQWTPDGFHPTAPISSGRTNIAFTSWNGYAYMIGGSTSNSPHADVFVARIRADGTLDPWKATTPLPSPREAATAVAWNGHLYITGGEAGPTVMSTVQSAPILANGDVGSWQTLPSLTSARTEHHTAVHDGYLYVSGGCTKKTVTCTSTSSVEYARLLPGGGLGSWQATTSLLATRNAHFMGAYDRRLYVVGGDSNGGLLNTVEVASLGANGSVGTWTQTQPFTNARLGLAGAILDGRIYLLGGWRLSGHLNDVQQAAVLSTGALTAWSPAGSFSTARAGHQAIAYDGSLFFGAGHGGTYLSDVQASLLRSSGGTHAWVQATSLPGPRYNHAAVHHQGYVYVVGGHDGASLRNDVLYAKVQADGSLGAWAATQSFQGPRERHRVVAVGGRLYLIGGRSSSSPLSDIQVATIQPNGALDAWSTSTTTLDQPMEGHAAVAHGANIFVTGGFNGSSRLAQLTTVAVDATGNLSKTYNASALPSAREGHESIVYNNKLYVLGGFDGTKRLHDVYMSALLSSGAPSAFVRVAGLPMEIGGFVAGASDGYAYVVGGVTETGQQSAALFAPLSHTGGVGDWYFSKPLPAARDGHAAVLARGRLYVLGGRVATAVTGDVQMSALNAPAQRGAYSQVFDTGKDSTLLSFAYGKTAGRGDATISYRVASDGGAFGPWISLGQRPAATPMSVNQTGRHFWFRIALDESQTAGAHADDPSLMQISDATLEYDGVVTSPAPVRLAMLSQPQTVSAGACSGAVVVQTQDATGAEAPVGSATTITLTATGGLSFFTDPGCTSTGAVTVAPGTSQTSFYFRGTVAGAATIEAAAAGFLSASQPATIVAGAPSALVFVSAPQQVEAGACSAAATVELQDGWGNPAPAATPMTLTLSTDSTTTLLFSDACTTPASQVVVAAATTGATFFFRDDRAGTLTVTAAGSAGTATQAQVVRAGAATRIDLVATPAVIDSGQVTTVTARVVDGLGNVAAAHNGSVTLLHSGPGVLQIGPSATAAWVEGVASWSITTGTAGEHLLTATPSSPDVTSGTTSFTVLATAPHHATLTSDSPSVPIGSALTLALQVRDAHENAVPAELVFGLRTDVAGCVLNPGTVLTAADGSAAATVTCSTAGPVEVCADAPAPLQTPTCIGVAFDAPAGAVALALDSPVTEAQVGSRVALIVELRNTSSAPIRGLRLKVEADGGEVRDPNASAGEISVEPLAPLEVRTVSVAAYVTGQPETDASFRARIIDGLGRELGATAPVPVKILPLTFDLGGCGCGAADGGSGAWPVAACLLLAAALNRRRSRSARG